jgi:hypothetical protein
MHEMPDTEGVDAAAERFWPAKKAKKVPPISSSLSIPRSTSTR